MLNLCSLIANYDLFPWFLELWVAQDEREIAPPNSEDIVSDVAQSALVHGINVAVEFKPVEHPIEPLDSDKPVQCPLPEPSILNVCFTSII